MNEAETRAELIDQKLEAYYWCVVEDSKVLRSTMSLKIKFSLVEFEVKRLLLTIFWFIEVSSYNSNKPVCPKNAVRNHLHYQWQCHLQNLYENRRRNFGYRLLKPYTKNINRLKMSKKYWAMLLISVSYLLSFRSICMNRERLRCAVWKF